MEDNKELLLLIMVEDASKVFKVIGYGKVAEKIEKNLERIYPNGRPTTSGLRRNLGL